MQILITSSIAGPTWSYQRGQRIDIPEDEAMRLVAGGVARLVEQPVETAAVAPALETATVTRSAKPRKR